VILPVSAIGVSERSIRMSGIDQVHAWWHHAIFVLGNESTAPVPIKEVHASSAVAGLGSTSSSKLRRIGTQQNSWARLRGRIQWHGNC
jgi:hypothetical protein